MKRYVAFCGNSNSGIQTKDKVMSWAEAQMTQKQNLDVVHIAEVFEVITRSRPVIEVHQFEPEHEEPDVRKAA